jgi:hypothetical protein
MRLDLYGDSITFEPHFEDVSLTAAAIGDIVGNAIRTLSVAFGATRRLGTDTVVQALSSKFTSSVTDIKHVFDIEVFAMPYGTVECMVGVTCDDFNLATEDTENLCRAITNHFGASLTFAVVDGKLQFSVSVQDIFA